jgi:predicted acetyltransferase
LPAYREALSKGWSPDNLSTERRRLEELAKIADDPIVFLHSFDDLEGKGEVTLPDGSKVPRLPSIGRWIWDGEFCGHISLRWQKGTPDLPPTCLGHIGYSVVPWKQRRGYATTALKLILAEAQKRLPYVDITTEPDNIASQQVIVANGAELVERFEKPASLGGKESLRFRINFSPH